MKHVRGGQGRNDEEIADLAWSMVLALTHTIVMLLGLVLGYKIGGCL